MGKKLKFGVWWLKDNPKWSRYDPIWSKSSTVKDTCLFKVCWEKKEDKKTNTSTFLVYTYLPKLIFVRFFLLFFMNLSLNALWPQESVYRWSMHQKSEAICGVCFSDIGKFAKFDVWMLTPASLCYDGLNVASCYLISSIRSEFQHFKFLQVASTSWFKLFSKHSAHLVFDYTRQDTKYLQLADQQKFKKLTFCWLIGTGRQASAKFQILLKIWKKYKKI